MPRIEFQNVCKSYGTTKIIDDVSFVVQPGSILTIIGQSGSGKTTLIKMINQLITLDENNGSILIDGKNIKDESLLALRRSIGYIFQNIALFPHMSVEKNINYIPNVTKTSHYSLDYLLQLVNLEKEILPKVTHTVI